MPSFLLQQKRVYYECYGSIQVMIRDKIMNRRKNDHKKRNRGTFVILVAFLVLVGLMIGYLAENMISLAGTQDAVESSTEAYTSGDTEQSTELGQAEGLKVPARDDISTMDSEQVVITPEIMEESEEVKIVVSAAGDCTLGTDEYFDFGTSFVAKYNAVGDPSYFFEKVHHIFESDDLTIVNFEGTLTNSDDRKDKTYAFKGNPSYAAILAEGSVEAANLANNHSFDYGEQSYEDTKKYLTEAGIESFGYDRNAVMEINGVKVGLIGIYELPYGLESADLLRENLADVKERGAQLIIVSFHWGTEKEHYPDGIQKQLAHIAIDEGAHLVLGHHPHVLQGIEEYKGRNIVYSLGNFCFGGNKNPSDKDTMIFQQTFTILDGVTAEDNVKEIIPCSLSSRSDLNNYQPMVLDGDEKQRVLGRIDAYSEGLSS